MSEKDNSTKGNKFDIKILRRLMRFLRPYRLQFFLLIFFTIIFSISSPIIPYLVYKTVDEVIDSGLYSNLVTNAYLMFGVLGLQAVTQFLTTYLSGWLGQNVIRDIRVELYGHILKLKLKFYDKTPIGRLVTRTVSDIETLNEVFSQGLAQLIAEVLQIVAILGIMFYLDWRLSLISLSTLPLLFISTYIFKEKMKSAYGWVRNAVANLNTFVQEHITGMSIIQIFGAEEREYERFVEVNKEHKKANLKTVLYFSIYFPVAEVVSAVSVGLLVWAVAYGYMQGWENMNPAIILPFIMWINMFFRPIRMIADRFNTLQQGIISTERIIRLLDSNEHIANEGDHKPQHLKGEIAFENVWFAYNEEDYVLKDLTFHVESGQTVAFVGATGAGKSSVINLLNRYYEISKGSIKIDGVDVVDFELAHLRKHIGVVLQDVFLFSSSIRGNISLGDPSISDEKIWAAADLVGASGFIKKLPGQLDYVVQERGMSLSVGQRQLISFVRAMVYDPQIIVLDEATSSIDSETEALVQNAIDKMMAERTSIVIAHRLSTIQKADKIIVLDKGEIMESGTHSELIEAEGAYYQLHSLQYKSEAV